MDKIRIKLALGKFDDWKRGIANKEDIISDEDIMSNMSMSFTKQELSDIVMAMDMMHMVDVMQTIKAKTDMMKGDPAFM